MTTKCTKLLFCWYVATNIDNTLNRNRNIPKLVFQKTTR